MTDFKSMITELRAEPEKAAEVYKNRLAFSIGPVELKTLMEEEPVKIIDARRVEDYETAHIPTAISVPLTEVKNKLDELSKEDVYVVYCYNTYCQLALKTALKLAVAGFSTVILEGGFKVWTEDFRFATEQ